MTTLYKSKALCVGDKFHTPNKQAISVIAYSFADGEAFTFCEVCEQNISQFSFYDEDRGIVYTKWEIEQKGVCLMAKLYTIEDLLIGKRYNSRSLNGVIVNATATDKVWFGSGLDSYLIEVSIS